MATSYGMDYWDLDGEPISREEWAEIDDTWAVRAETDEKIGEARWNGFSARFEVRKELIDHGPFLVTVLRQGRLIFHKRAATRGDAEQLLADAMK